MDVEKLRYPIGKYNPGKITIDVIEKWVEEIEGLPKQLKKMVDDLDKNDLAKEYRPGGWNVQQLVHHLADSHMNAFMRFKLALTEDSPVIKPYLEGLWADMYDVEHTPISSSVGILEGIHQRWINVHEGMSITDYSRTYTHPEHNKKLDLAVTTGMYAWHGKHHLEHIKLALK